MDRLLLTTGSKLLLADNVSYFLLVGVVGVVNSVPSNIGKRIKVDDGLSISGRAN